MVQDNATDLERPLAQAQRQLSEALERQAATDEVLRVISSSPGDLQPVFNTMLENALRICEAKFGVLFRIDDEVTYPVAMLNLPPAFDQYLRQRERRKPRAGSDLDMLCRSRQVVHTVDMLETSSTAPQTELGGARTQLAVPMLKDNGLVGAIIIYRQEVRPFTDKQIELVQKLRRPGSHRHREHAAAERAPRVAAAADRYRRRAQGHQPFDLRFAGGARYAGRVGRTAMRRRRGWYRSANGNGFSLGRELRPHGRAITRHERYPDRRRTGLGRRASDPRRPARPCAGCID